jgi:hypothetical protein
VYTVTAPEGTITDSEPARTACDLNPKTPAALAGWAMSFLLMPHVAPIMRAAPFPRVRQLMDALDGVRVQAAKREYRFLLPGPDDQLTPTWLDDIPL